MRHLVATGIVLYAIDARNPQDAIYQLKARIRARRHEHHNPNIGMSLVDALDRGSLDFLVLDENRRPICGEFDGAFVAQVDDARVRYFRRNMPNTSDFGNVIELDNP